MDLIGRLGRLVLEGEIERDLIALVHDRARARHHAADVEALRQRNGLQIFLRAFEERIGGVGEFGFGPKNDDVRKHGAEDEGLSWISGEGVC